MPHNILDMNATSRPFQSSVADTAKSEASHSAQKGIVSFIWLNDDSFRENFQLSEGGQFFILEWTLGGFIQNVGLI